MQDTLMQQGVELMLYGMGTVFVFLALLIFLTTCMSAFILRFVQPGPVALPVVRKNTNETDPQLIAVITAAVHKHRSRNKL